MVHKVNVLVVGAGVIGSSVAMHLAKQGISDIRVIDFDLEGSLSSSELNAGGVRATWLRPLNIQMSQLSIHYFSEKAEEVGYRACGYLWLLSEERLPISLKARDVQLTMGWPVEAWDLPELQRKVPFIDKTEGIAGAIFAPRDGLINPNLVKNHYRTEAKKRGVIFDDRTLLFRVDYPEGGRNPIHALAERIDEPFSSEAKLALATGQKTELKKTGVEYHANFIVNCAGPWASEVAQRMGYSTSSRPIRRQISVFDAKGLDLSPYGMIVDTSGVYFHPEATHGLAGFANSSEPEGLNFEYDGESFFQEFIWPALYERSTYFEKLKHLTGWAGLYEVSPDESAILGSVTELDLRRQQLVFEAHSFSGHGVMQSYAAGLALAEKIARGRYETIDAEPLSGARFRKGQSLRESLVI